MQVTLQKLVADVDITLHAVYDSRGNSVPIKEFSADEDDHLIVDLETRICTREEEKILNYLTLKGVGFTNLTHLLEQDPF